MRFKAWATISFISLFALLVFAALGCGGGGASAVNTSGNTPAPDKPSITSALNASGTAGQPFSYQITATNNPTTFGASGLPSGLSVNTTSGVISGTPTTAGTSNVALSATNSAGTGTAALVLTIGSLPPQLACSPSSQTVNVGQAANFSATGGTGTYSWSAPGGNPATGTSFLFSATYAAVGSYTVTVISGSQTAGCSVTITTPAIKISVSPQNATAQSGSTVQFKATITGTSNNFVTWTASAGGISGSSTTATFTAPNISSQTVVTVTATLASVTPPVSDSATVTVNPLAALLFSPAGLTDGHAPGRCAAGAGTLLFCSDSPSIKSSSDYAAGMVVFDLSSMSVVSAWNTGSVPAQVTWLASDANNIYAVGILNNYGSNPALHEAWLAIWNKSSASAVPMLTKNFQLGGVRTEAYGVVVSQNQLAWVVRTDDVVCWGTGTECADDAVVLTDLNGNIASSFPVGNTQAVGIAPTTKATSIAASSDGSTFEVVGDTFDANGNHLGYYEEIASLNGTISPLNVSAGGPSVGVLLVQDATGNTHTASTGVISATVAEFVSDFGLSWNGGNTGSVSVNVVWGANTNPAGGDILLGSLSKLGSNDPNQTDGGAWAVDMSKCNPSTGCPPSATIFEKRTSSVTGGSVSSWDAAYVDAAGNLYLYGRGVSSDGTTKVVLMKNP